MAIALFDVQNNKEASKEEVSRATLKGKSIGENPMGEVFVLLVWHIVARVYVVFAT